ncbi:hypothetical protein ACA910_008870 [Epithemia clementina (nom. ined.)]
MAIDRDPLSGVQGSCSSPNTVINDRTVLSESVGRVSHDFAARSPAKQEEHPRCRVRCGRRRVTINEDQNCTFPDLVRSSQDECSDTWFDASDYQRFRISTDALVKTIAFGESLSRINNPDSFLNVLDRIYQSCCEKDHESNDAFSALTKEDQEHLINIFQQRDGYLRVGLEHRIAKTIRRDLHQRRRAHLLHLLERQDSNSSISTTDSSSSTESEGTTTSSAADLDEEVCQASLSLSRAARLFSQQLARAQLLAAS